MGISGYLVGWNREVFRELKIVLGPMRRARLMRQQGMPMVLMNRAVYFGHWINARNVQGNRFLVSVLFKSRCRSVLFPAYAREGHLAGGLP